MGISILLDINIDMLNKNKQAFTLVELIVVITILAILGTIAFISMNSYSESARNSTRVSDLSTMKTSLELFHLDAGKYPKTTGGFEVTYSGTAVWYQGIFGDATTNNVDRLDKIPKDPLTEKEYTYSVTSTRQEYQLSGLVEGDGLALDNPLLSSALAGDVNAIAIVTGNYNGVLFKTLSGTTCEVLAIPSILSALAPTNTYLEQIVASGGLVYDGYNNLPSDYIDSKYNTIGGFDYSPTNIVAYQDNQSCEPLFNADNTQARADLITGLQGAYSGTIMENEDLILTILNTNPADTNAVNILGAAIVNNSLGGTISTSTSSGGGNCVFGQSTFGNCTF